MKGGRDQIDSPGVSPRKFLWGSFVKFWTYFPGLKFDLMFRLQ